MDESEGTAMKLYKLKKSVEEIFGQYPCPKCTMWDAIQGCERLDGTCYANNVYESKQAVLSELDEVDKETIKELAECLDCTTRHENCVVCANYETYKKFSDYLETMK